MFIEPGVETMRLRLTVLVILLVAVVATLPSCSGAKNILADDEKRKELIETMVTDRAIRKELIDRLVGPPTNRAAVIARILEDEDATGHLIQKILATEKGKAIVASQVAADSDASTFVRMLMLTGAMGEAMTQKQADIIGMGHIFSYGNQRRTMSDMKRIAEHVEAVAKQDRGQFPICADFENVDQCLEKKVQNDAFQSLKKKDAWGHGIQYRTDPEGSTYLLISYANDGEWDGMGRVGPTESVNCDIVFANGDFIQWPGNIRKSEIR